MKTLNEHDLLILKKLFEFKDTKHIPLLKERKEKLHILLNAIIEQSENIEKAIYADFKKPYVETKITEILPLTMEIRHILRNLNKWMKPKKVSAPLAFFGSSNKILFKPKGNTLIISPWNYPLLLAVGPVVSAIAAGNNIVLKPSEISEHTSSFLKKFFDDLFEKIGVKVIEGGAETAQELLKMPFDHIFFTGGTKIGKIVMEAAAKNLTSVTLELGGKSPVIIEESADIKNAAKKIVWGKFFNAGQTCVAPDYVIIAEKLKEEFIDYAKVFIHTYFGDTDLLESSDGFCSIINANHTAKLQTLISNAVDMGAKIETDTINFNSDNFIPPTILSDVNLNSKIMQEEIFGPILPVLTFQKLSEVNKIISHNPNPLSLYIFSEDMEKTKKIINSIPAGGYLINDVVVHFVNNKLPLGGIKTSGIGLSHGYYGFKAFSNEAAVMKQPKFTWLQLFYPPYTKRVKKLVDIAIKYL